jgi:hypothetical protein
MTDPVKEVNDVRDSTVDVSFAIRFFVSLTSRSVVLSVTSVAILIVLSEAHGVPAITEY